MYQIRLTPNELATLAWATDRGYFPEDTYDGLTYAECNPHAEDEQCPRDEEELYELGECDAHAIIEHRLLDPHSLYTCIGEPLLSKLITLEQSIV